MQGTDKISKEQLEDIKYELEMIGLPLNQQLKIMSQIKNEGFSMKQVDDKLEKLGYHRTFEYYYEEEQ
jgi:hypothetical protein